MDSVLKAPKWDQSWIGSKRRQNLFARTSAISTAKQDYEHPCHDSQIGVPGVPWWEEYVARMIDH